MSTESNNPRSDGVAGSAGVETPKPQALRTGDQLSAQREMKCPTTDILGCPLSRVRRLGTQRHSSHSGAARHMWEITDAL